MKLFHFKKKKDIPSSSQPSKGEVTDFDNILADIPPAPPRPDKPELSRVEAQPVPQQKEQAKDQVLQKTKEEPIQVSQQPLPAKPIRKPSQEELKGKEVTRSEVPAFELSKELKQDKQEPQAPTPAVEEGFELPDFDDHEIKEFEELRTRKEVKKKPEPPEPVTYPEPEKPVIIPEWKFISIERYINIRENINKIKLVSSDTQRIIDEHALTSKAEDNKYKSLTKELNSIQNKLILIDNKLFKSI